MSATGADTLTGLFVLVLFVAAAVSVYYIWRAIQEHFRHKSTIERLLALTPAQFERRVMQLFEDMGYTNVTHAGKSNDRGADIVCKDEWGRTLVIQCKRFVPRRKVGSPAVQRLGGAERLHKADHTILVTTSRFTAQAMAAAGLMHVTLIDGDRLTDLIARVDAYRSSRDGSMRAGDWLHERPHS